MVARALGMKTNAETSHGSGIPLDILVGELAAAPSWAEMNSQDIEVQGPKLLAVCQTIAALPENEIRDVIVDYMKDKDWRSGNYSSWTKIYVLNRVCFDIPARIQIQRLFNKYFLDGGAAHRKYPYDPEEVVNGMYPLAIRDGKLSIRNLFLYYDVQGVFYSDDRSYPVLEEFDYLRGNFHRRKNEQ